MSSELSGDGKVVAFYSFKGGTGRTMALSNVGCLLAQRPSTRVLLIDWDLEAPGLHRYFRSHLFRAFRGSERMMDEAPGLIDLFAELRDRLPTVASEPQEIEDAIGLLREVPVSEYIFETDIPNLSILKAGRFDAAYAAKVATFDWPSLYQRSPFLLRTFADRLARNFGFVLVDSRTGLTDTSGICTMLLPEAIVAVFTPNRQSLTGVIDLIVRAGQHRAQSDDLRPLVVYPLPSRIEASEPDLRKTWRFGDDQLGIEGYEPAFRRAFMSIYDLSICDLEPYFDDVQVQHVPRYAYGEQLAVLAEEAKDRLSLTRSYQQFSRRLFSGGPPWAPDSERPDEITQEDVYVEKTDDLARARASASYFKYAKIGIAKLRRRYEVIQMASLAVAISASVAAASFAVVDVSWPLRFSLVLIACGAAVLPLLFRAQSDLRATVEEAERELKRFEGGAAPFDRLDAADLLRDRLEPLLDTAGRWRAPRRKSIFISYRRDDGPVYAGRIYDYLAGRERWDDVFLDVDNVSPGQDFRAQIESMVNAVGVVLVIIGPNWLARSSDGKARISEPSDFIRLEIATALRSNALVVPVLVDGAEMPSAAELPDDIQRLVRLQAVRLSHSRFSSDILALEKAINLAFGT
jgi:cellulose biosynthesis protein BcsQ